MSVLRTIIFLATCLLVTRSAFRKAVARKILASNWVRFSGGPAIPAMSLFRMASISLLQALSTTRHTILQNTIPQDKDPYGHFPVNCPNGSGYSIRLGNSGVQAQAERVSYTFTVPADKNEYSFIYNYAIVFQNPFSFTGGTTKIYFECLRPVCGAIPQLRRIRICFLIRFTWL
jgi:hypothetical protein